MVEKRVTLTDSETGERRTYIAEEDSGGAGAKTPRVRLTGSYVTIFAPTLRMLAADRRFTMSDLRVYFALLAQATGDGTAFRVQGEKLSAATIMHESNIAVALRRLREHGLIERPQHGWVRLNPRYAWRGPAAAREEALAEQIAAGIVAPPAE